MMSWEVKREFYRAPELLSMYDFNPDERVKRSPRRKMTWLLDEQEEEAPGIEATN